MAGVTRTHKIQLDPTCKQQIYFAKACGIARFTWNWALANWEEGYKSGQKVNAFELKKQFNALKSQEFPWIYEVTKYASQQPFIHLKKAFQAFFNKTARYPKYKRKGVHDSFYIGGDQVKVVGNYVKIPNLGWVRLRESLRFEGKINGVTISRKANRWFVSVHMETNQLPKACESQAAVGVDLGIKTYATLSNGEMIANVQPLKKQQEKLRRLQRRLSRRKKGSRNRLKTKMQIANLHYKIANARNDYLHKLTTDLTEQYRYIVIEDLDISEMLKSKKIARSLTDCGMHEFRRQLTYKALLRGNTVFLADRWFASSKRCSGCGKCKQVLSLSERTYICEHCGFTLDRDHNAARNLEQLVSTVSSTGIDACGQDGSLVMLKTSPEPAWTKQELSPV